MKPTAAAAMVGIVLAAGACAGGQGPARGPAPARAVDFLHPRYFVNIYEVTRSGDSITLFRSDEMTAVTVGEDSVVLPGRPDELDESRVHYEVDKRSKIVIEFDRARILKFARYLEAQINILGQLKGPDGVSNVEIPGYSMVGEERRTATARFQSGAVLRGVLGPLAESWNDIGLEVDWGEREAACRANRWQLLERVRGRPGLEERFCNAVSARSFDEVSDLEDSLGVYQAFNPESFPAEALRHYLRESLRSIEANRLPLQQSLSYFLRLRK